MVSNKDWQGKGAAVTWLFKDNTLTTCRLTYKLQLRTSLDHMKNSQNQKLIQNFNSVTISVLRDKIDENAPVVFCCKHYRELTSGNRYLTGERAKCVSLELANTTDAARKHWNNVA